MGSILWRGEGELTTIFEQTEEGFLQNGGGLAVVDISKPPPMMVPIEKIYLRRGAHEASFKLMEPKNAVFMNPMGTGS